MASTCFPYAGWQMTNAGWQMTNAGWRMGDDECRDETGHPRFPSAKKWLAPSARAQQSVRPDRAGTRGQREGLGHQKRVWRVSSGQWPVKLTERCKTGCVPVWV